MTAVWLLLLLVIVVLWISTLQRKHQQLQECREEVKLLRRQSGGLEKTLATRGRRLDVLLSAVNEVVMRVDRLGRVMAANQRAHELFEMDRSPGLPQSMLLFYRDPDWQRAYASALKKLPEASTLPEMKINKQVLAPRLAPLGEKQALLLCVDMTELHRLEQQRRTFLANLMHDLKTPLTSLLGYARSMNRFGDDEAFRKEAAGVIADEARHVNHLLDALLTLDQIEFTRRDEEASSDVQPVLQQVVDMLKPRCDERSVSIRANEGSGLKVAMDVDDLERVLTNLLTNAVQHSPAQGEIRIDVEQDDGGCRIIIEDQGAGIPERDLPHVTERFYRVDQARSRQHGGHGLGLAIVKELLEKNGGSLTLSNREPHGLKAEISVPLDRHPEA